MANTKISQTRRYGGKLAEILDKVSTSMFFSYFPKNWTKVSMWKYFN